MRDDDLEVIEAYCRRAAVSAIADLVRAQDGQLALPAAAEAEVVVTQPVTVEPRHAIVTPVAYTPAPTDKLVLCWRVAKVVLLLGAGAAVVWLVVALLQALAAAIAAVIPVLVVVAVVIVVIVLLSSLRGGRTGGFSGTWWTH